MIGPAADEAVDADRLARAVVDEVDLRLASSAPACRRASRTSLRRCCRRPARAGCRNASSAHGAHELDAAAGDDERLEAVGAQVAEQFEHRLVDALGVGPLEPRMLRGRAASPARSLRTRRSSCRRGWPAMISSSAFSPPASAAFMSPASSDLNGSLVLPLRMLRRQRLDAVEREQRTGSTSAARTRACRRCRTWRSARRAGRSRAPPSFVTFVDEARDRLLGRARRSTTAAGPPLLEQRRQQESSRTPARRSGRFACGSFSSPCLVVSVRCPRLHAENCERARRGSLSIKRRFQPRSTWFLMAALTSNAETEPSPTVSVRY